MFIGWVPSITGRLSFSQIGKIGFPKADFVSYSDTFQVCTVRCAEIRTKRLDDSIFSLGSTVSRCMGVNIVFELDARAELAGLAKPILSGDINCYTGKISRTQVEKGQYKRTHPAFKLHFYLSRTGLLIIDSFTLGEDLRSKHEAGELELDLKYLVDQGYFFLKDMIHRHRHHHYNDDTFIRPLSIETSNLDSIAFQLGKRVIRRPITRNLDTYQSALGILSYLRSYQEAIQKDVYTDKNLDNMEASLSAEHSRQNAMIGNRKWLGAALITLYTFGITKFVKWNVDPLQDVTTSQFFSTFGLITIVLLTAHFTYVFNWSNRGWYLELLKYFSSLQYDSNKIAKGRFVAGMLFILFAFLSYLLAVNPELLDMRQHWYNYIKC